MCDIIIIISSTDLHGFVRAMVSGSFRPSLVPSVSTRVATVSFRATSDVFVRKKKIMIIRINGKKYINRLTSYSFFDIRFSGKTFETFKYESEFIQSRIEFFFSRIIRVVLVILQNNRVFTRGNRKISKFLDIFTTRLKINSSLKLRSY